jgi:hypothetical protein
MSYSVDSKGSGLSGPIRQFFENMQASDIQATVFLNFENQFGGINGSFFESSQNRQVYWCQIIAD